MNRRPVALVTAEVAKRLDDDLAPLSDALGAIDVEHRVVSWDDADVDWSTFGLVVVRSTWDYVGRLAEFMAWAERVDAMSTMANRVAVLRWSTDKHYLDHLLAAGVAIVPTTFLEPPSTAESVQRAVMGASVDDIDVVVKPTISAGSANTARYSPERVDDACDHARRLLDAGRSVMVQPYQMSVDRHGETAVVFFGGLYSHAFRKGPILDGKTVFVEGLFAEEQISATTVNDDVRSVAESALEVVPGGGAGLLYGRVDVVVDESGSPAVLEMELCEPSVYLRTAEGSAARFALAIDGARRLATAR